MNEPNPDGSDPEIVDALIEKLVDDRLRYRNLPREAAIQIVEEAAGKLLSLPGVVPLEERAIKLADSGLAALCMAIPVPGLNVAAAELVPPGFDLIAHALVAALQKKWLDAEARADVERKS